MMAAKEIADDLDKLLDLLPEVVRDNLKTNSARLDLLEIILDLGRLPEARYNNKVVSLGEEIVSKKQLQETVDKLGQFGEDNRAGIEGTLHRISAIRNRKYQIVGLTCRVGRAVYGTVSMIRDLIESGKSLLLMGRPGVGKTTALREIARVIADELMLRVVIIDTSNEIAGDGDIPHPAIGKARRMQVTCPENQHKVMIEAVENHMPQVIVIDEIGTELEATAARTIAERGVQLIATAHGNSIANLIKNPTLSDLIGGVQSVTLGDEEARRRRTQKTVLERAADPTFSIAIEMNTRSTWSIHADVALTVDALLRGKKASSEKREVYSQNKVKSPPNSNLKLVKIKERTSSKHEFMQYINGAQNLSIDSKPPSLISQEKVRSNNFRVFCFGVSSQLVFETIKLYQWPACLVEEIEEADVIISLRNKLGLNQALRKEAKINKVPIHIIKSENIIQIERALRRLIERHNKSLRFNSELIKVKSDNEEENALAALEECRIAIEKVVLPLGRPVELLPRSERVLRMQIDLVARYRLRSDSFGHEDNQWLRVYPP